MATANRATPHATPHPTLFLGHSFVRRASQHLLSSNQSNLNLPLATHDVMFQFRGGAHIADIMHLYRKAPNFNPDIVVIDIGTNDLFNFTNTPSHSLALQLFDTARHLVQHCGVRHVIILEVLPRTTWGRFGAPQSFSSRVARFNTMLKSLVSQHQESTPISFWFHKGILADVSQFILDGCHLNPAGMTKYLKSVRRAILFQTRALRRPSN